MKKRSLSKFLLGAAACFAATSALAQSSPTITVDGNPGDWPAVLATQAYPKNVGHDPFNSSSDDVFTSGATTSSAVSSWVWGTGTPNAKSDIENSAVVIVDGKLYFYADRYAGNGDVTLDVWLFAGNVGRNSGPPSFYGVHQDGDMVIRCAFNNGGGVLVYTIYKWAGGVPVLATYPTSAAYVVSNTNTPNVPAGMPSSYSYTYKSTGSAGSLTNPGVGKYPQSTFVEGFIDLNAIANDPLAQCFQSYLITTTTSSSTSLTSAYTDFVTGNFPSKPLAFVTNSDTAVCSGATSITLRGGAVAGYGTAPYTYKWTNTPSCGSSDCVVGTGANYTFSPTTSGTYYLTAYSSYGCVSIPVAANVTVNTTPAPTTTGAATCAAGAPATLKASGTGTLKWYADATGGTCLNTGANYAPAITATATYYVSATNTVTGCTSTRTPVTDTLLSTYTITASSDEFGSISNPGITSHCQRDNVTYTFTSSYPVQDVIVDGASVGKKSSHTFNNLNANHTIDVKFCNPTTRVSHDDISVYNAPGSCGASITIAGATANGAPAPTITYSKPSGIYSVGNTPVSVTAYNTCGSVSSNFNLIITDNEKPVIAGIDNITQSNNAGICGATVDLSAVHVEDNCIGATLTKNAPDTFSVGTTIITWIATDASGNTDTAWQVVTIVDNEKPSFTFVPHDTTVNANISGCSWWGNLGDATATDNCGLPSVTNDAVTPLPVGTNTVTWTATDAHGNKRTATQLVTVINPVSVSVSLSMLPVIANGTQTDGTMYWGYQYEQFTAIPSGATGTVSYIWVPTGETTATITQYPNQTGLSEFDRNVNITDGIGCTATAYGGVDKTVIDARCGNGNTKVSVCHWDNGAKVMKTICIDQSSVADHMGHTHLQGGVTVYDYCGPCVALAKGAAPAVAETINEINLYPNPNKGSFIMEIPATSDALVITITDLNGRVVETRTVAASENGQHLEISLSNVSKGIYMVQAVGGELSFRSKLVIE